MPASAGQAVHMHISVFSRMLCVGEAAHSRWEKHAGCCEEVRLL